MKIKNYGMKVKIKFKEDSPFKGSTSTYRNVTEIHYNYLDGKPFGKKRTKKDNNFIESIGNQIAFESDIHSSGITQQIKYIEEFETRLETKKQKNF